MKRISIIIIALGLLIFIPLKAQDTSSTTGQTSIGVNPSIMEVVTNKDSSVKQDITVLNLTDSAIPIVATKEGFSLTEKTDVPADKLDIYDASSWITLSDDETNFILQPKEIKTITLNIKQPENSSPGGHYATVYFQSLTREDAVSNNSASINIRIGVLILIQVPGDIVNELRIKELSSSSLSNTSQLTFNLKIENTGNVHQLPTGKVNFYNELTNQLIKTIDLDNRLVLPGIENNYIYSIDPGYQIGRISAQAEITYGPSNKVLTSEKTYVTIFPVILAAIILFLILFTVIFRKRVVKAFKILTGKENTVSKVPADTTDTL